MPVKAQSKNLYEVVIVVNANINDDNMEKNISQIQEVPVASIGQDSKVQKVDQDIQSQKQKDFTTLIETTKHYLEIDPLPDQADSEKKDMDQDVETVMDL